VFSELLSSPLKMLILCGIIAFVFSSNMILFRILRGDRHDQRMASKWSQAFGGGAAARRRQADQLDQLHQAAERLRRGENSTSSGETDD
jgi:hypothetical protein